MKPYDTWKSIEKNGKGKKQGGGRSISPNPNYEEVRRGLTGHNETMLITRPRQTAPARPGGRR